MAEISAPSSARPGIALGLTFLIIGLSFALPFPLIPEEGVHLLSGKFSPEVANVYACVAWPGWAHFLYAFRGQGSALKAARAGRSAIFYALAVLVAIAVLVGARWIAGPSIFGALVWIYFIDHFLKAEQVFEGRSGNTGTAIGRWLSSYQPLLTFGWLTVVLMNVGNIDSVPWLLWSVSLILSGIVLSFGGWKCLSAGKVKEPLLSLFFIAEALVWGTFSRYGGPMVLTGVYVFHIAAGSYYHYLGSYFMANSRRGGVDRLLRPFSTVVLNLAVIGLGVLATWMPSLAPLRFVLGPELFSLWVGLHLVTSDLFPHFKAKTKSAVVVLREAA